MLVVSYISTLPSDCVSWVPRLTLTYEQTGLTSEPLERNSFMHRGFTVRFFMLLSYHVLLLSCHSL